MRGLPPSLPLPMPIQTMLWIRTPTRFLEMCRRRFGHTFTVKLPPNQLTFVSDPDAIRTVFTAKPDEMHAGEVNRLLRVLVGSGSVLLLDGAEHMRHRKLLLPSFHGDRMRHYGATMAEVTRRVVAGWPSGTPFSVHPHTQAITLEVILRTVFGVDDEREVAELGERLRRLLARGESKLATLALFLLSEDPKKEKALPWRWLLRQRNEVDSALYERIARRRAEASSGRTDVLGILLAARDEAGKSFTDSELRDELVTALAAGHETTATALAWAFEQLLSHPRALGDLCDEIRALGPGPEPEKVASLPYLDAVVKEVLRLRPVVPIVGRVLKKPFRIAGYDLPEGRAVAPCIYLAQRNPDVYEDAESFRPERFVGKQPDPYSWLPFGGGFRRCIGAAFATFEMKVVLATILAERNLRLEQKAPARVVRRAVTFYPEHGTRVSATPLGVHPSAA